MIFPPGQIAGAEGVTVITGFGLTVIVTVAVFVQPFTAVPVTVYVVVTVGDAVGFAQVVQLNPVAGAHTYVLAPLAVMINPPPKQIDAAGGVTVIVGRGNTVTVQVAVPVQPKAFVPVTVYVVVTVGEAVTTEPVVALKFVAGAHT